MDNSKAEIAGPAPTRSCHKPSLLWTGLGIAAVSAILALVRLTQVRAASRPPRFEQLKLDQLNPTQRRLAEQILKVSSIGLAGPYNSMLRSPEMGERLFQLLDYLRFHTSVPRKLNEFAILIQARQWTSQVEWTAHYPLALKAGLSHSVVEDLRQGRRPRSMSADEAVVYDLSMELATKHELSDATFARARTIFSEQQLVDLVTTSGAYITLAMMLKTADEQNPAPNGAPLLPPLPGK